MPHAHHKKSAFLPVSKRLLLSVGGVFLLLCVFFIFLTIRFQVAPHTVGDLVTGSTQQLKSHERRTNVVLLGIGGVGHDSGDLTDTILLASIDFVTHDVLLFSLPRDIWVPSLNDKINAAYRLGEEKKPGAGFTLTKSVIEEIVGIPIHYALQIDFSGFKDMIDAVGGIDVTIDETFTDDEYPIAGRENDLCNGDQTFRCRYETITFTKGIEHMDGTRALKYVRSRHAQGEAGNDYSRNKRQKQVLLALKEKMVKTEIITNFDLLKQIQVIADRSIKSDMTLSELLIIGRAFSKNEFGLRSAGLTEHIPGKQTGLLINPPVWQYGGAWVLVPKDTEYTKIHEYVLCLLQNTSECEEGK